MEAHQEVRRTLRRLFKEHLIPQLPQAENLGMFPQGVLKQMGELGLAGPMLNPPLGLGELTTQLVVAEEMGQVSSGFGLSVLSSICLFGSNVDRLGTPEQKDTYLPSIASGDKIGCWALTEPEAGSDAISIQTHSVRRGNTYVIQGTKTFITNAPIADFFIVLTREVDSTGKPLGGGGFWGGTAFVLEKNTPGLKTGKAFDKLGHWCSPTGEIFLDRVEVPVSQVLGKPGEAFLGMKTSLDIERCVFGGLGVGLMEYCLKAMIQYAATRKQFGVSILEHQLIQDKIARVSASLEMTRTYLVHCLHLLAEAKSINKEAAIAKMMGSQMAVEAAREAIQVLGGYGYMREYQVERCFRDAKLYEIGGGTTEIQKMIIAKQTIKEVLSHGKPS
jgi:alkylation response protein AidB-like acyl-CoA dehydrogenase